MNTKNILIPLIRKMMPQILANDIVGVQPMTGNTGQVFKMNVEFAPLVSFEIVTPINKNSIPVPPDGFVIVNVRHDVSLWIQEQPPYMWKSYDFKVDYRIGMSCYMISEQLYTLMALKWA